MTDREKIMSEDYYDFLTDSPREEGVTGYFEDGLFLNIENDLSLVYIKKDEMSPQRLRGLIYRDVPKLFGLMGLEPLMKCGILQVQGAPLNLTGRGVVLGFLDTGIRYDEEVFRNPDGSTRILGIWDQEIQSGQPPAGFLYGTEYTRELIQAALQSEKPRQIVPSYDENGHGTEIASGSRQYSFRRLTVSGGSTGCRYCGCEAEAGKALSDRILFRAGWCDSL